MRAATRLLVLILLIPAALPGPARAGRAGAAGGVDPYWRNAYVLSFRSMDLLTNEPDERWGRRDARLVSGGILSDFPRWLEVHAPYIEDARMEGRPVLLSLHVHSGYGTGLVTYSGDLQRAEVANYPWLLRTLERNGIDFPDVTVAVDTCNSQATAARQLRPDLIPGGVEGWDAFTHWQRPYAARRALPLGMAYQLFCQDRVAGYLTSPARGHRGSVRAAEFLTLTSQERRRFRGRLYGQRGVIVATPAFFNLLRLGPEPHGTLTANLLTDRLDGQVVDALKNRNVAEFRRFRDFAFLDAAGPGPGLAPVRAAPRISRSRRSEGRTD